MAVPRGLKPRSLGKCRERGKYAHPAVRPSYHIIDHLCSTADSLSEEHRGMESGDQMYQEIGWSPPPHMHAVQSEAILHCWCAHPGQVRLGKSRFLSALRSSLRPSILKRVFYCVFNAHITNESTSVNARVEWRSPGRWVCGGCFSSLGLRASLRPPNIHSQLAPSSSAERR